MIPFLCSHISQETFQSFLSTLLSISYLTFSFSTSPNMLPAVPATPLTTTHPALHPTQVGSVFQKQWCCQSDSGLPGLQALCESLDESWIGLFILHPLCEGSNCFHPSECQFILNTSTNMGFVFWGMPTSRTAC